MRNYKLKPEDWKKVYEGTRNPATFEEDILRFAKEYKANEHTIKRSIGYHLNVLKEEKKMKDKLERQMKDAVAQPEEMETEEATQEDRQRDEDSIAQAEDMDIAEATQAGDEGNQVENVTVADQSDTPLPGKDDVTVSVTPAPPRLFREATSTKKFLPNCMFLNP